MKREQTKREQIGPVNAKTTLPVRQINWLVTSWAFPFRLFIYPFVRPERFDCLYRSEERRQPESVLITASLLLIQKIFNIRWLNPNSFRNISPHPEEKAPKHSDGNSYTNQ